MVTMCSFFFCVQSEVCVTGLALNTSNNSLLPSNLSTYRVCQIVNMSAISRISQKTLKNSKGKKKLHFTIWKMNCLHSVHLTCRVMNSLHVNINLHSTLPALVCSLSSLPVAGLAVPVLFPPFLSLALCDKSLMVGVSKTASLHMGASRAVINTQWSASTSLICHELQIMGALIASR